MTAVRIEVVTDLSGIPATEWDRIVHRAGGSIFHRHGWLTSYARAAPHKSDAYYLVAYRDRELVALLPAFLTRGCPRLRAHRRFVVDEPTSLAEPMLLAHSLYSYYGGPLAIGEDEAPLLRRLVSAFEDLAQELGAEVHGFVNLPETRREFLEVLLERGYAVRYLASSMYLPIVWASYDAYLKHLPLKPRRNLRYDANRAERSGLRVDFGPSRKVPEELVLLIESVFARHRHADTNLYPRPYLEAISEDLSSAAKYLTVRSPREETLASFLVLDDGETLTPWVAGIDYEHLREFEPYHMAYRWLIDHAIRSGYREIDFGRGSYRFKRRYGCLKRTLYLALGTVCSEHRQEVDRWSKDLAEHSLRRYARHFETPSGKSRNNASAEPMESCTANLSSS